jgi:uncharacterized protein YjbJ (UPF0337 family)
MDKDRITGSARDFAGKVEGTVGNMAGDTKAQADGLARQATGTAQDLYGQAKDMARDATDAATNYAKRGAARRTPFKRLWWNGQKVREGLARQARKKSVPGESTGPHAQVMRSWPIRHRPE